jgi:HPt (histidine-containing phosphotransfer) domain-containing protein
LPEAPTAEPVQLAIAVGAPVVDAEVPADVEPVIGLVPDTSDDIRNAEIEPVAVLPVLEEPVAVGKVDPVPVDPSIEADLAPAAEVKGLELDPPADPAMTAIDVPDGLIMVESTREGLDPSPIDGFEGNGVGHEAGESQVDTVDFGPVGETVVEGAATTAPVVEAPVVEAQVPPIELIEIDVRPSDATQPEPEGSRPVEAAEPEWSGGNQSSPWLEPAIQSAESDDTPGNAVDSAPPAASEPPASEPAAPPEEPASELPVLSTAMLDQLAQGGGFGLQHLIVTFLRETPARIADLATAVNRGDGARATQSIGAARRLADLTGAERLVDLCGRAERATEAGNLDTVAAALGELERAFLDVRTTIDATAPPLAAVAELPSINPTFLDQLSPAKEGSSRQLATRLADTFKTDGPARLSDLRQAVERGELDQSQRIAQTMKGMCGLIGAEPMAKLCALVEADARLKRIGQSRRYLEQLSLELERVLATLQSARG